MARRSFLRMQTDANRLMDWLEERADEQPELMWPLAAMAYAMGWTSTQVKATIGYTRNTMTGDRYLIVHERVGRRYYYKVPTSIEDLRRYELVRAHDGAVRVSHVLLMVRKGAHRFGVTTQTRRSSEAYVEAIRWLGRAGIENAEELLVDALRSIEEAA